MGTRSSITAKFADGSFKSIYCHWDGYLSHNGKLLLNHYSTQERVEALITPGDISSLAASCDKPDGHSYNNRVDGYTVYYGRDRGEDGVEPRCGSSAEEAAKNNDQEYNYRWNGEQWFVSGWFSGEREMPLAEAVEKKADEED